MVASVTNNFVGSAIDDANFSILKAFHLATPGCIVYTATSASLELSPDTLLMTGSSASARSVTGLSYEECFGKRLVECFPDLLQFIANFCMIVKSQGVSAELQHVPLIIGTGDNASSYSVTFNMCDSRSMSMRLFDSEAMASGTNNPSPSNSASRDMLKNMLFSFVDGVVVINQFGMITLCNQTLCDIVGYKESELVGKNINMLMDEPYTSQHNQHLARYAVTGVKKMIGIGRSVQAKPKSGELLSVNISVSEFKDRMGDTYFTGVWRDLRNSIRSEMSDSVINASVDGIIVIDQIGNICLMNHAAEKMFRVSEVDLKGKNIRQLMPEPHYSLHDEYLYNYRTSGRKRIIGIGRKVKGKRSDGTLVDIDLCVSEFRSVDGTVHYTGLLRDITAQQVREEKMSTISAVVNQSSDFLCCLDIVSHKFQFINKTMLSALEHDLNAYESKVIYLNDIIRSSDVSVMNNVVLPQLKANRKWKGEVIYVTKSGDLIATESSLFIITTTEGSEAIGIIGRDTRDQKRNEKLRQKIEKEKLMMEAIVNGCLDFMSITSIQDMKITYLNSAGRRLVGLTGMTEDTIKYLDDIHPNDEISKFHSTILPAIETKGEWSGEVSVVNAETGEVIPVEVQAFRVKFSDETPLAIGQVCRDIRDRRRLQRLQQNSDSEREKIFAVVNNSADWIGIVGIDNEKLLFLNESGSKVIGLEASVMASSLFISDFLTPRCANLLHDKVIPACIQKGSWKGHLDILHIGTGEVIPMETSAFAMRVAAKVTPLCIGMICRDNREQIKAQEALQLRELAISNTTDGITICDYGQNDYPLIYANSSYCQMTGYAESEIIGKNLRMMQGMDTDIETVNGIKEAILNSHNHQCEILNYRKNGQMFWNQLSIACVKNELGRLRYLVGVSRDITQKKQSDMERLSMRDSAIEATSEGILILDGVAPSVPIIYCNSGFCEISGFKKLELVGKSLTYVFGGSDLEIQDALDLCRDGKRATLEVLSTRTVDRCQILYWVKITITPIAVTEGRLNNYICVVSDITESKQSLAAMESARNIAENAAQAKSDFLSNMSHEIRTPLNGIIGLTFLLLQTTLQSNQRELVTTVRKSGEMLLTVVNDILDFSKIESSKLILEHRPVRIRQVLSECLDVVSPQASDKGIDLALLIYPQVPDSVTGDETRIRQVLLNLLGNSIKFTDYGCVTVVLSASINDGLYRLHFEVKDTGIGIQEHKIDLLFHSFTQADTSSTRRYGGTGLGLAICKKLVEAWGGVISVSSVEEEGSNFNFTLSCADNEAWRDDIDDSTKQKLSKKTCLFIDDLAINREVMGVYASQWGLQVTAVNNGEDAKSVIENGGKFDVIVCDYQMPDMDGKETAQGIRALGCRTPIILYSSVHSFTGDSSSADLFSAILMKPIRSDSLLQTILQATSSEGRPAAAVADTSLRQTADGLYCDLRILLTEDNPTNQMVAVYILKEMGYTVTAVANDGIECLEKLETDVFDIVLMDMKMPRMDGVTATETIMARSYSHWPHVIGLTACVLEKDKQCCLDSGMIDVVTKPINPKRLKAAISKSIGIRVEKGEMIGGGPRARTSFDIDRSDSPLVDRSSNITTNTTMNRAPPTTTTTTLQSSLFVYLKTFFPILLIALYLIYEQLKKNKKK